ncbi:hypothetical protein BDV25DRAFT_141423 [Aspergillus avenaceus]|uniref:Protein SQS1 n=1 Tax=Aspergillus avenaceus TaxID=36643 RepID=A0A5N6TRB0_ASPAV|nr:hypothetical protein BDV25DRAFT_141423 [Aspergillus avenaceus]
MARHSKAKARNKGQKPGMKSGPVHPLGHLTMQQEARNTEGRNLWRQSSCLRHQTVSFVSAGSVEPEVTIRPEGSEAEGDREELPPSSLTVLTEHGHGSEDKSISDHVSFFMDVSGENITCTGLADPIAKLSFSGSDDSSEDEVVFHGRRRLESRPQIITDIGHTQKVLPAVPDARNVAAARPNRIPSQCHLDQGAPTNIKARENTDLRMLANEEDDILTDYITNMAEQYREDLITPSRDYDPKDTEGTINLNTVNRGDRSKSPISTDFTGLGDNVASGGGLGIGLTSCEREENSNDELDKHPNVDFTSSHAIHDMGTPQDTSSENDVLDDGLEGLEDLQRHFAYSTRRQERSRSSFFASANAFADALEHDPYYGLDIMDFSRPSLQKKSKGKTRALDMVPSDSELEMQLENAWWNDREKKKVRKQRREELRRQGLLGKVRDNPDLKSKYSHGMSIEELKEEIRVFLLSSKNSLPLPPMDKQRRKLVHDLANALTLNSQSRGKGTSRFPILHKTSRTPRYTQKTISRIDTIFTKGRFNHGPVKSRQLSLTKSAKSRRGRPDSSVSYMDGDIVGASAPEIGIENKGRAMLEKMGWSTGTALGATNNKGILLPVAHVVKNSKAGLG